MRRQRRWVRSKAHAKAMLEAAEEISDALHDIADAIREVKRSLHD
jgi:hypothetical protein